MSHATVRRRARDGLTEVIPNTVSLTRAERYEVSFGVFLVAKALYLSAIIPPQAFAIVLGCCLAAELAVVLREAGLLQPPKAPVLVLPRWRPPGGAGRP
ncbi:MAG TPA: hypothetical protein VLC54_01875 [Anaeromyxobacter sp.]|nr:hypothetical protein [Anaeromyxobacter sp.]